MAKEIPDISPDMQRFYKRFERWRSAHTGRLPIPERLWRAAAELAREHGVFPTAKALRLEYGKLKDRAEALGQEKKVVRKLRSAIPRHAVSTAAPTFMELITPRSGMARGRNENLQQIGAIISSMKDLAVAMLVIASTASAQTKPCGSIKVPKFTDFPVRTLYTGKPKQPTLTTRLDHEFRTTIREAARKGANFAGHYAVAEWGCGTGCRGFVVVDVRTGKVSDPPFRDLNFHYPPRDVFIDSEPNWLCIPEVIRFRKDSELLTVEGCLDERQCGRTYYRMDSTGLRQIAYDPDLLPDGKIAPF